jgi:hypothetical protein
MAREAKLPPGTLGRVVLSGDAAFLSCTGLVEVVAHGGFRMFAVSGSKPIA